MLQGTRLETERLIIRPFDLQDAESLHQILRQEEVVRYLPEDVMSAEEVKKILAWLTECYKKNTPDHIVKLTLAMVWKKDRKLIGWCGFGPLDFEPEEIEIFYGLSKNQWGKGIATEAARKVLHYGFETIGLDEIVAVTHPRNVASIRVIEKLGFVYKKKVGSLPNKYKSYEGYLYHSLSRDEYPRVIKR